jgi:hypothetical protein
MARVSDRSDGDTEIWNQRENRSWSRNAAVMAKQLCGKILKDLI